MCSAVAVEVISDGTVIRRVRVQESRPDVAVHYPGVQDAEKSGFRTSVSVLGMTSEIKLALQVVLRDQRRIGLGEIKARRRWLDRDYCDGTSLVSVIIPCYNQAQFLGEAIESVLAQSYPDIEIVVVDDGSTDNTAEIAARYPGVRCVRQENAGLAAARNTGMRRSNGSFLVFLDADDRLLPQALETGLNELNKHPECAFVSGHCCLITIDGRSIPSASNPCVTNEHYLALLRSCYIWMPATVMYRRDVFDSVAGFKSAVSAAADYDLYLRIAKDFPVYCHDQIVAEYRHHGTNMSNDPALMLRSTLTVLRNQWSYARQSKCHKSAYKAGVRFWQHCYGEPLVDSVRSRLVHNDRKRILSDTLTLLRYYPQGTFSLLKPHASDTFDIPKLRLTR